MSSQERFNHPVSLNKEQEDLVNRARAINGASYAQLVVLGAEQELKNEKKK